MVEVLTCITSEAIGLEPLWEYRQIAFEESYGYCCWVGCGKRQECFQAFLIKMNLAEGRKVFHIVWMGLNDVGIKESN